MDQSKASGQNLIDRASLTGQATVEFAVSAAFVELCGPGVKNGARRIDP
jgi:hypothetical protein